ncbi:DUF1749-domain-containing protein [Backusella circina FSU 941]|nr:DUF1749-domain-containing protein [Backusella circina FSU 941]
MELSGSLFTYSDRLTAFESGPTEYTKTVVFVGGLGDAYNAVKYLVPLQKRLERLGWTLTQVELSSSGVGYGISSLIQDSAELDELVQCLRVSRNKEKVVFLGHSTGCQDSYWHNKYMESKADGYIFQAPISDRLSLMNESPSRFKKLLEKAKQMISERKGEELMPRQADMAPITAERLVSLLDYRGDDDVFSPDLKDKDLEELYANVTSPICWVYSEQDEYYVEHPDDDKQKVMERFQKFCPAIKMTDIVPFGDHCLSREDSQEHFFETVEKFLGQLE